MVLGEGNHDGARGTGIRPGLGPGLPDGLSQGSQRVGYRTCLVCDNKGLIVGASR